MLFLVKTKNKMSIRQTSIDCYNEIKANGLLSKRRLEVYEAILKNAPCTSNEALKDLGVIYEKSIRKCRVTGKNVIEWDLTDKLPIKIKSSNKTKKQRINDAIKSFRELYKNKDNNTIEDWKIVADLIKTI